MNCGKCQNLISPFLDGELDKKKSQAVQIHISMCSDCAKLREDEDVATILNLCNDDLAKMATPPNSQALWRRINNIIVSEMQHEIDAKKLKLRKKTGLISRAWSRKWQFSTMQIGSAALVIAIVSSLLTVVGIKSSISSTSLFSDANAEPTMFEHLLADIGVAETQQQVRARKIRAQKSAIEYWEKYVQTRKIQWDVNLRKAFDRNLGELDKAVDEYMKVLEKKPQDKIHSEMLDSALNEKMDLLREFSEL